MTNILTEKEFIEQTHVDFDTTLHWINQGALKPFDFQNKFFFFPKHIRLMEGIKELVSQNIPQDIILTNIENDVLNVENVLSSQNIETRSLEFFQGLTYEELIARCRESRVVGFRRMTREEMETCLFDPSRQEEIVNAVRSRNRRTTTSTPVVEENVVVDIPTVTNNSYSTLSYKELVEAAKNNSVPNFRRMSKNELLVVLGGTSEQGQLVIDTVRERTRQRYGSGSAVVTSNQTLQEDFDFNQDELIEDTSFADGGFYEEPFIEVQEEIATEDASIEDLVVEEEEFTLEIEETEIVLQVPTEDFLTPTRLDYPDVDLHTEVINADNPTPFSLEELQGMNSKQVAVVVRDYAPVKYFRRMTKEELIICIFEPARRAEMSAIALERYERYRGMRYGQNN